MCNIQIVVDGGFSKKNRKKIQFAFSIKQVKNSVTDVVCAPAGRKDAVSGTREYEQKLGNDRLAAEVAELNAVAAALTAADDAKNGYYDYPVQKTTVFIDSSDALRDIRKCRRGVIEAKDGSYADRCRIEMLEKIQDLLRPTLVRFDVNFRKVNAHETPDEWNLKGMSDNEATNIMLVHTAMDGLVKEERKKKK